MGITFVPETLKDTIESTVIYRHLQNPSPSLQLAIARRHDNFSLVVQHFFKIVEEVLEASSLLSASDVSPQKILDEVADSDLASVIRSDHHFAENPANADQMY